MHFDWILFDADHTLFDFDRSSEEALNETLSDHGVPYDPRHWQMYDIINKSCWAAFERGDIDRETMRVVRFTRFFEAMEVPHIDHEIFGEQYLHKLPTRPYLLDGAMDLLHALHGNCSMGIITNGLREVQRPRLQATGIDKLCEVIVVSGEINLMKPQHDFFAYAHRQMGEPEKSKVLVVGDSLTADIRGGAGFGFRTCWVNPDMQHHEDLIVPDYQIRKLDQLPRMIGLS